MLFRSFDTTGNLNLPGYSTIQNQGGSGTLTLYPDRTQPDYGVQSFISFDNDIHLQSANIDKGMALGRSYGSGAHIRIVGNVPVNPGDSAGDITIHAQDYEGGTAQQWQFGADGNLTLPDIGGTIEASMTTVNGALQLRSNTGTEMDYYDSADENHFGYISIEDRKSTRLNSSHVSESRMPSSA